MSAEPRTTVPFSSYAPCVVVVTGTAQGIGYAIAHRFANDGIGVAVNDTAGKRSRLDSAVDELRRKGRRAIAVPGDVSSEADVIFMTERTATEPGSVDIMVANAEFQPSHPLLRVGLISLYRDKGSASASFEASGEMFDSAYSANVRGAFFCFRHAALQMIKQGLGGRLIAASSSAGKQGTPNLSAYSASNFAVCGPMQTASIELRRHGITANSRQGNSSLLNAKFRCLLTQTIIALCLQLFGVPDAPVSETDTVASIASCLVKTEAYFINGQSINVDGGLRHD
ncbi:hypothetical protein ACEPAI_6939 [Sanghuangporus weigelae]